MRPSREEPPYAALLTYSADDILRLEWGLPVPEKINKITQSDVRYAYRLFLDREPENEQVVEKELNAATFKKLRENFLSSAEFKKKALSFLLPFGVFPVGLHLDVDTDNVDMGANPEQRSPMFERTAELGKSEPYFSVITNEQFKSVSIEQTRKDFYGTGISHINTLRAMLLRNGLNFPTNGTALDFGCGVGRLTFVLARYCKSVIGLDFSMAHLHHAHEAQRNNGISNVNFLAPGSSGP